MLRKSVSLLLAACLIFAGVSFAAQDNPILPGDLLHPASRSIENAHYQLARDNEERALIQNQYAERRMTALGRVKGEGKAAEILEELEGHENELVLLLEELEGPDAETIIARVHAATLNRGENLRYMIENGDIPDEAKEGMTKALVNQAKAMEKFEEAIRNAMGKRDAARTGIGTQGDGDNELEIEEEEEEEEEGDNGPPSSLPVDLPNQAKGQSR